MRRTRSESLSQCATFKPIEDAQVDHLGAEVEVLPLGGRDRASRWMRDLIIRLFQLGVAADDTRPADCDRAMAFPPR